MTIEWWAMLPFAALLLAIATFPLIPATRERWAHLPFQLGLALLLGIPVALWLIIGGEEAWVVHAIVEYAQFITVLLALFVVSGGIFLAGDIQATPRNNTIFLAIGGVLASFIGTTGAAMLLIRPLLNTNRERERRVHTVVFAIMIVANCGGLLTPLGDPPLFLGLLRGVPFLWTMSLFPQWLFVNALLLATYYALDRREVAKESEFGLAWDASAITPLNVRGRLNFLYLTVIIAAVAFAPSIDLHAIEEGHPTLLNWIPIRELLMLGAAAASYLTGDEEARFSLNGFEWEPIQEVAALFIGIFLTMIPALKFLAQIAPTLPLDRVTFFIFSGGLSAVLDNAPTYATFFEMAKTLPGDPRVADVPELYLVAISLGSVFCGAITYIGNGPNFMVKAVAENMGVAMPSFGGYVGWTFRYLVPVLAAMVLVFLTESIWWQGLGVLLTLLLLGRAVLMARTSAGVMVS
ncbi:MAG: sodium:proton antiporter [Micropruina sp.]|nr:sodium:proton antiporter [Micropruina sp.]